jgi:hypothetical protein
MFGREHCSACDAITADIDALLVLEGEELRRGKPPLMMVPADFDPGQIDPPGIITYKADDDWRPIDSAPNGPRDAEILVTGVNRGKRWMDVARWNGRRWEDQEGLGYETTGITHWRPLPEPPQ